MHHEKKFLNVSFWNSYVLEWLQVLIESKICTSIYQHKYILKIIEVVIKGLTLRESLDKTGSLMITHV